jgi:hypothetical protein
LPPAPADDPPLAVTPPVVNDPPLAVMPPVVDDPPLAVMPPVADVPPVPPALRPPLPPTSLLGESVQAWPSSKVVTATTAVPIPE